MNAAEFESAMRATPDCEVFTHLQQPQRRIALIDEAPPQTLRALVENTAATGRESTRLLLVRVLRDYGLTDRSEAPQARDVRGETRRKTGRALCTQPAAAVSLPPLSRPRDGRTRHWNGISPSIQEKSCDVEPATTGVQLPFWFWLQA